MLEQFDLQHIYTFISCPSKRYSMCPTVYKICLSADQLNTCGPEQFRCAMGSCIPIAWQCDGEKDCPGDDNLDEWGQLCGE